MLARGMWRIGLGNAGVEGVFWRSGISGSGSGGRSFWRTLWSVGFGLIELMVLSSIFMMGGRIF